MRGAQQQLQIPGAEAAAADEADFRGGHPVALVIADGEAIAEEQAHAVRHAKPGAEHLGLTGIGRDLDHAGADMALPCRAQRAAEIDPVQRQHQVGPTQPRIRLGRQQLRQGMSWVSEAKSGMASTNRNAARLCRRRRTWPVGTAWRDEYRMNDA